MASDDIYLSQVTSYKEDDLTHALQQYTALFIEDLVMSRYDIEIRVRVRLNMFIIIMLRCE
jgi:hypothetical protein